MYEIVRELGSEVVHTVVQAVEPLRTEPAEPQVAYKSCTGNSVGQAACLQPPEGCDASLQTLQDTQNSTLEKKLFCTLCFTTA